VAIDLGLEGRTALVTGAGGGVGAAIAASFVRAGATVWVNDVDEGRARAACERMKGSGKALPVKADVTSPAKVAAMAEATGPVDILVNNAGVPTSGLELKDFVDTTPADWEYVMWLNLGAVLHVTHAYLRPMIDHGWGRIVTIVSDAGRKGERYQTIYGAGKAGAMGFSRGLSAEVARHGVTVNCISLGTMRSGSTARAVEANPELEARLARAYPIGRIGLPDDVAPLATLLCSEAGAWITGQVYPVNGGYAPAL
jgi:NAD(P)-dependent dehydrogenase (short-subunit alcohol dehydrogenase family)